MISFQLYSSRNFPPLAATLRMLGGLGYAGVEGYGALFADEAAIGDLEAGLRACRLAMPTAHFALDQIEGSPEGVLSIARRLGIRRIFCPWIAPGDRPTDAGGWHAFGARLQAAGAPFRAAGLGFGWHNHDFEMLPLPDGSRPLDHLFAGGPDLEWQIDVAWVARGGEDPFPWVARHADRITAAHVKDIAPSGQNPTEDGWADLGRGILDWRGLFAALRRTRSAHFVIEHDNPSDHLRFARESLAAARGY